MATTSADTSPINGTRVQHAEVHAAERHSWNCGYWPEPAYRVTGGWNGRNMPDWSNQPPVDPNWVGGTWSGTACGSRTAVWNVTGFAAHWAANPSQSWGVSLRTTNEGDNNQWKKYASTEAGAPPALHVWYTPPANVWGLYPTNGARVLSSTTTASAYYADANGTAGQIPLRWFGTPTAPPVGGVERLCVQLLPGKRHPGAAGRRLVPGRGHRP